MDKNNILDLIKEISQAAVNLPQNKPSSDEKNRGSFKTQIQPPKPAEPVKIDRTKRPNHSTGAIIKMIQQHNALAMEISKDVAKNKD